MARAPLIAVLLLLSSLSAGCRRDDPVKNRQDAPVTHQAPRRVAVDRLAPGEIAPGKAVVWGLTLPKGMTLQARFKDTAHVGGTLSVEALTEYVGQRVEAQHVEVTPTGTVFPRARIKGGPPDRFYRLEISRRRLRTRLVIRDLTPPPTVAGLTEAERWERLGLTPNGEPINPKELQ